MNDPVVPWCRLAAGVSWSLTFALIAGAWATWAFDLGSLWLLLGLTGCAMSAVAATMSVRGYATRITRLIRLANGLPPAQPSRLLRSVGD